MKNTAEKVTKLLIGEKVKRLRTMKAWSQEKLAEKAGVDVRTIQRLENGENRVHYVIFKITAQVNKIPHFDSTLLGLRRLGLKIT